MQVLQGNSASLVLGEAAQSTAAETVCWVGMPCRRLGRGRRQHFQELLTCKAHERLPALTVLFATLSN